MGLARLTRSPSSSTVVGRLQTGCLYASVRPLAGELGPLAQIEEPTNTALYCLCCGVGLSCNPQTVSRRGDSCGSPRAPNTTMNKENPGVYDADVLG